LYRSGASAVGGSLRTMREPRATGRGLRPAAPRLGLSRARLGAITRAIRHATGTLGRSRPAFGDLEDGTTNSPGDVGPDLVGLVIDGGALPAGERGKPGEPEGTGVEGADTDGNHTGFADLMTPPGVLQLDAIAVVGGDEVATEQEEDELGLVHA